jgi:hypothetical protein
MLSRLQAIQDIRLGRGIQLSFVGAPLGDGSGRCGKFSIIIRRGFAGEGAIAHIECQVMRRTYKVRMTSKQVLAYIRRHYPTSALMERDTLRDLQVSQ